MVYHPGAAGFFDDNAILFEFLASHGYVVLSSAYQTNTRHVSNDVDLTPRSIQDMQFLMQAASKLPYVDMTKVAGIGHSAGAQTLMRWIGEVDCPLTAMVSLDTTVEYTPRNFPGHKELRQALDRKHGETYDSRHLVRFRRKATGLHEIRQVLATGAEIRSRCPASSP